jgi:hypothetical protein
LLKEQFVNWTIITGDFWFVKIRDCCIVNKSSMQDCQDVIQGLLGVCSSVQQKFILLVEEFEQLCSHLVAIEYLYILVVALFCSCLLVEIPYTGDKWS